MGPEGVATAFRHYLESEDLDPSRVAVTDQTVGNFLEFFLAQQSGRFCQSDEGETSFVALLPSTKLGWQSLAANCPRLPMGMTLRQAVEVEAEALDLDGFIVNDTDEDGEGDDDEANGDDSEVQQSNDQTTLVNDKGPTGRLNASQMPFYEAETGADSKIVSLLSSTQDEQDMIEDSEDDDDGWEVLQAAERRNKEKAASTSMVRPLFLFWSWKQDCLVFCCPEKLFWAEHMQCCRLNQALEQMATSSPTSASSP